MARTVNSAFTEFLKNHVNLDPEETKVARKSRDFIKEKIVGLPSNENSFPVLYEDKHIYFGSFARRTKKRALDDIDMMICMHGSGFYYSENQTCVNIHKNEVSASNLHDCFDNDLLNSRKVIEKFKKNISSISHYSNSEIHRTGEALTVKLSSYSWNFDIVPCFVTAENSAGQQYYLIPDGQGAWKKTDPRIDQERSRSINQKHKGNVLEIIRLAKYWNKRQTMPSMGSFLLENMVLNYFDQLQVKEKYWPDIEFKNLLEYLSVNVWTDVLDPKGIQGNINDLTVDQALQISTRASNDHAKAVEARKHEEDICYEQSINKWKIIFGSDFPNYG